MKRLLVIVALFALFCGLRNVESVYAGSSDKPQAAVAAKPGAADFVGSETCATCHADIATRFASNPHSKLALMHGATQATCESCHGPGKAHVDSGGDATKIFQFTRASARQIDTTCLGCHAAAHPNFQRSEHAKANLSCTSCHSIHATHNVLTADVLLKAPEPQLCYQCHGDVRGTFAMPFHHPVPEGAVTCSDCHDAHGTFLRMNLKSTVDQNQVCTKCHIDTRGPFVYEHAPVKAEGCMSCHTPHGSQNARLLNMPSINTLCNQCHSPVAAGTFHSMGPGSAELAPCTSCHTYIHGSNLNPAFLK